jgi:hypothetical protein
VKFASVREAAESYAAMGFRPMPMYGVTPEGLCRCGSFECRPGKHARPDVEATWKEGNVFEPGDFHEHDNIALALGPWGGSDEWLVCLDVDGPLDIDAYGWDLPPTLTQKSPRGLHLFFSVPAYTPLGNWVDVFLTKHEIGAALDIRYARGRINVSPSRSSFGQYSWIDVREPARLPEAVISSVLDRRVERGLPVQWEWDRDGKRP